MGSTSAEAKLRYWGAPVPQHLKHGNATWAAKVYGCDCAVCLPSGQRVREIVEGRALTRGEILRRSRQKLKGTPVPPGTKHGIYTYKVYGCPCDVCKQANRDRNAARRKSWRDTARGRWYDGAETTTLCWPPKDAGPDWKCPHETEAAS